MLQVSFRQINLTPVGISHVHSPLLFPAVSQQLMTELMTGLKVCLNCCLSLAGNFPGSVKVVEQFVTGLGCDGMIRN